MKIYDLEKRELKTVLEVEKKYLSIYQQDGNQWIRIGEANWEADDDIYLMIDWSSGKLITPTPIPMSR